MRDHDRARRVAGLLHRGDPPAARRPTPAPAGRHPPVPIARQPHEQRARPVDLRHTGAQRAIPRHGLVDLLEAEPPSQIDHLDPHPSCVTRSSSSNRDQQHVALRVEVAERRHEHRNHRHQNPPQQRTPAIRASQPQRSQTGTSRWFTTWTQPVCQPSPRVTAIASPRLGHEPDTRKRAGGCKGAG